MGSFWRFRALAIVGVIGLGVAGCTPAPKANSGVCEKPPTAETYKAPEANQRPRGGLVFPCVHAKAYQLAAAGERLEVIHSAVQTACVAQFEDDQRYLEAIAKEDRLTPNEVNSLAGEMSRGAAAQITFRIVQARAGKCWENHGGK